jgi:hypothetical protein
MAAASSGRIVMTTDDYDRGYVEPVGQGWLFFAGTILGLAGIMRILDGIWALRFDGAVPDGLQDAVFGHDLDTYGWLWIAVGVLLILVSFGIVARSQLSRWIGYVGAVVLGVSATVWLPYYPVWSLIYVAIAVMVFYALARYGGRQTT